MDITPIIPAGRQLIRVYGGGGFIITDKRWDQSVLVFPTVTKPWAVRAFADIDAQSFSEVTDNPDLRPEILLLGCGGGIAIVPGAVRQALRAHGVVIEAMDTGAACRTYNILLSEDRRVAAALIAV